MSIIPKSPYLHHHTHISIPTLQKRAEAEALARTEALNMLKACIPSSTSAKWEREKLSDDESDVDESDDVKSCGRELPGDKKSPYKGLSVEELTEKIGLLTARIKVLEDLGLTDEDENFEHQVVKWAKEEIVILQVSLQRHVPLHTRSRHPHTRAYMLIPR